MGRRTFESLPGVLPKRRHLVLSRDPAFLERLEKEEQVEGFASLPQALKVAYAADPLPFVIGGASVYREALPLATVLYLTQVDGPFHGDVYFPDFSREEWQERERRRGDSPALEFVTWRRRPRPSTIGQ